MDDLINNLGPITSLDYLIEGLCPIKNLDDLEEKVREIISKKDVLNSKKLSSDDIINNITNGEIKSVDSCVYKFDGKNWHEVPVSYAEPNVNRHKGLPYSSFTMTNSQCSLSFTMTNSKANSFNNKEKNNKEKNNKMPANNSADSADKND